MRTDDSVKALLATLLTLLLSQTIGNAIDMANHPGKAIYQKLCVDCHGADGVGNPAEDIEPLIGRRSLESLAGRIERTMPEDDEDACVGPDAKAVAEYIYHAFYSPEAQAKKRVFRPRLSRLTVEQYQNSVIDVFAHFRNNQWQTNGNQPSGLAASYSLKGNSTRTSAKTIRTINRTDARIAFDYKNGLPDLDKEIREAERREEEARRKQEAAEKAKLEKEAKDKKTDDKKNVEKPKPKPKKKEPINKREFSIKWRGGIYARHSGVYEFSLRLRNGAYLNINEPDDDRGKMIDAWVAPNNDIREVSAKIYLVGGRTYPLDLHFFKFKEDLALIELWWKPPHGIKEIVPAEVLSPTSRKKVFVPSVRFPADDRSLGYETGSSISRAWIDAITQGGLEAANHAVYHLTELCGILKEDTDEVALEKLHSFAGAFAEYAFRKPLPEAEKAALVGDTFDQGRDKGMQRFILKILTSPEFLYPSASASSDQSWKNGAALASALWDSIPDRILRSSAEKGQLDTEARLERWADRMLDDTRARHKMDRFFHHWLELEKAVDLAKDKKLYPEFNTELVHDLTRSLEMFVDEVVWSEQSDYRKLYLNNHLYANSRIAKIYGAKEKPHGFQRVVFENENRSGVITHPLILTMQSYHNTTSPIHRGVFLSKNILGLPLKPPKEAVVFNDEQFDPNLTMREKVTKLTESKACMACHSSINPLGFSLEHFDAIGRWREKDAGKKVNDDSALKLDSGEVHHFKNPKDLAKFAAESPMAQQNFIRHLFHHMVKQPIEAYGLNTGQELYEYFKESEFSIKDLMVKIAVISATRAPEKS